ncbi:hypothetical protein HUG10_09180 [Halorarum halophilum]|uniref:Uncharacterized protein n=2 Tax=Halorarum halophilum TaxID=2743090 RepID=A0A7D5KVU6_9EURY|nr:hypothetical protein HUG10_09180 [Halobaculum halophilum]
MSILGTAVPAEWVAVVVLAFTAGMCVPFRYGIERLRGFGRVVIGKLPYAPPPGKEEGEAMEAATEGDHGSGSEDHPS